MKFDNEPFNKAGMYETGLPYPCAIWPKSDQYRIVRYQHEGFFHQYGLEAYHDGGWVKVLNYEDGYDDYGQLEAAKWEPLHKTARWDICGLENLVRRIKGLPDPAPEVLSIITG